VRGAAAVVIRASRWRHGTRAGKRLASVSWHERARLLGFLNNAAFRLEDKMVKTLDTVNEFLADLQSKLTPSGLNLVKS